MEKPPKKIDGAEVLCFTIGEQNFGVCQVKNSGEQLSIKALAICTYPDSKDEFYLFACDDKWDVVADLWYSDLNEAQKDAERYYETGPLKWESLR